MKYGFIGAGNMGSAIVKSLIRSTDDIVLSDRSGKAKALADELNISKQKLYRYIKKNHINDVHHDAGVMYIDDALESAIKSVFQDFDAHHDVHQNHINDAVFDTLLMQLEQKD
ncbi:MAG: NAD(P)-binding domain-containing protein, partial [Solobacterium sp.]|nr:NAD(P)-binding domain-containing protein [Solobacterium sp.]